MRKVIVSLAAAAALLAGLAVGADLSGAGNNDHLMQAVPPESVEPATVTVSNVDDPPSRCEEPNGGPGANPELAVSVEVSLNVTSTNGFMQADTVTPDAAGNWMQVYTDLAAGTYTVTGACEVVHANGGMPVQSGPFTYVPVEFVVTAPEAPADAAPAAAAPAGVVAARPSFTG